MRHLILTLCLALVFAAPADARVTGAWGKYQTVAANFKVPLPDVYVHRGGCPDWSGPVAGLPCSHPLTNDIWIPDDADRFALAHELGHQFDRQYLTDPDRDWLRLVMHADPDGEWSLPSGPDEWFADFYADCAVGNTRHSEEGYADRPTPKRLRRVCTAIRVWGLIRLGQPASG